MVCDVRMRTRAPHRHTQRDKITRKCLTVALPPQPAPFLSVAARCQSMAGTRGPDHIFSTLQLVQTNCTNYNVVPHLNLIIDHVVEFPVRLGDDSYTTLYRSSESGLCEALP